MSRQGSILGSVDIALRMLDANAHGKGLLCEGHVVVLKELKISRAECPQARMRCFVSIGS